MFQLEREKRKEIENREWESFFAKISALAKFNNERRGRVSKLQLTASNSGYSSSTSLDCSDCIDHKHNSINNDIRQHLSTTHDETRNASDGGVLIPVTQEESSSDDEHKLVSFASLDRAGREDKMLVSLNYDEHFEFNPATILDCRPAISPNADEDYSGIVPKQVDLSLIMLSVECQERLDIIWSKMGFFLDKILYLLDKTSEPEDIIDDIRRRKRAAEFSVLFGRNYVYPLSRKLKALSNEVDLIVFRGMCLPLGKKLVEAHQYAASALAAYANHIPKSVVMGLPDKLRALLKGIVDLCDLCKRLKIATAADDGDKNKSGFLLVEEKSKTLEKEVDKLDENAPDTRLAKSANRNSLSTKRQPKKHMQSQYSPYELPVSFPRVYREPILGKLPTNKRGPPKKYLKNKREGGASKTGCAAGKSLAKRRHPNGNVSTMVDLVSDCEREANLEIGAGRAERQTVSEVTVSEIANPVNVVDRVLSDVPLSTQPRPPTGCRNESISDPKMYRNLLAKFVKDSLSQQQKSFGVKNAQLVILPQSQTPEICHISVKENNNKCANQKAKKRSSTKIADHVSADTSSPFVAPNTVSSRNRVTSRKLQLTVDKQVCDKESGKTTSKLTSESISHMKQDINSRVLPAARARRNKIKPETISTASQMKLIMCDKSCYGNIAVPIEKRCQ